MHHTQPHHCKAHSLIFITFILEQMAHMEDFHFYFRDVHINSCLLNSQPVSRGMLRLSECLCTYTYNIFRHAKKKKKNPIIEQSGVKKKSQPVFVFLCGIKDQGAASAIVRRWELSSRSQPPRNRNFCSLLPQQFFLPVALNTNCLIARVHAPTQRVAVVAVGNLGNQFMKWEPAKPRSTLNYNSSWGEGKKREKDRG